MKAENIKFKAKALGTGEWVEGFLQRDIDYNLYILKVSKEKKGGNFCFFPCADFR